MRQAFGTHSAERASLNIRERAVKPGASCPGKAKSANAQRGKVRGMGDRKQVKIGANLMRGDTGVKVFVHPSRSSGEDKVLKWSGVQNAVKNMKCPFLRLIRMKAQCPLQLFEERVTPRGDAGRMSRRDMGSEKMQVVK